MMRAIVTRRVGPGRYKKSTDRMIATIKHHAHIIIDHDAKFPVEWNHLEAANKLMHELFGSKATFEFASATLGRDMVHVATKLTNVSINQDGIVP